MVNCRLPSCQTLTDRSLTLALSPLLQRRLSQSLSASPSSSISFSSSLPIIDPVVTSQAVGAVNTLKRVQVHQCPNPVFFFGLFWVDGYPNPPTQKEPLYMTHCMPSFRLIRPCTSQPQLLQSLFALSLVSHTNVQRTYIPITTMSQVLFPSFSLVLNSDHGSTILRDYERTQRRELFAPMFAPLTDDEGLMRTLDLRPAPVFVTYERDYFLQEQDSASLFGDAPEKKFGFYWRHFRMLVERIKGLGGL